MKIRSPAGSHVLLFLAAAMETLLLSLHGSGHLRYAVPEAVSVLLTTSIFYILSAYWVARKEVGHRPSISNELAMTVLSVAFFFRLTLLPLPPGLSDDLFRYRWEGMIQAKGENPYQVRPSDPHLRHLRDETYARIPAPDDKAGYGPLIELIQWGTYHMASAITADPLRQVMWFKLPGALFDLGVIAALWALLAGGGLPRRWVLIYAWSPLAVFEFWASGHNDSIAILLVVLALYAAQKYRWVWSFAALSLAACAKIWPLILFPVFVGRQGWRPARWWQWTVGLPIAGLLAWPYWSDVSHNVRFVSGFLGGWRNNDSAYGLLLALTGDQYSAKYAAFGIVIACTAVVTWLRWPLEKASLWVITTTLIVSANCHPWYLTWIIPLLVFIPVPALLLWTALAPLSYRAVIHWALLGEWQGSTPWRWLIYVPVYTLLVGTWLVSWVRRRGSRICHPIERN